MFSDNFSPNYFTPTKSKVYNEDSEEDFQSPILKSKLSDPSTIDSCWNTPHNDI